MNFWPFKKKKPEPAPPLPMLAVGQRWIAYSQSRGLCEMKISELAPSGRFLKTDDTSWWHGASTYQYLELLEESK